MRYKAFSELSPAERARLKAARKSSVAADVPVEPPPAPANPEAPSQAANDVAPNRHGPNAIRDAFIPTMLQLASSIDPQQADAITFRAYRNSLVWEGGSQDILEQLLLEQVALAHISAFQLAANAGMAKEPAAAGIYAAAAAKLLGEARRTIIAIKDLHRPPAPPTGNIAVMQSVTVSGKNEADAPGGAAEKVGDQSKLGSNNAPGHNRWREMLGEDIGRAQEPAVARAAD